MLVMPIFAPKPTTSVHTNLPTQSSSNKLVFSAIHFRMKRHSPMQGLFTVKLHSLVMFAHKLSTEAGHTEQGKKLGQTSIHIEGSCPVNASTTSAWQFTHGRMTDEAVGLHRRVIVVVG